ncbi:hypothetical protein PUR61_13650, partial [Streptomyces sp. BE20]|uniref:hypothetical protein n=1 Tax=Streptomyces sp. BE20 TaxID=3002525 RepID=UPI002E7899B7
VAVAVTVAVTTAPRVVAVAASVAVTTAPPVAAEAVTVAAMTVRPVVSVVTVTTVDATAAPNDDTTSLPEGEEAASVDKTTPPLEDAEAKTDAETNHRQVASVNNETTVAA